MIFVPPVASFTVMLLLSELTILPVVKPPAPLAPVPPAPRPPPKT